jgi:outer membrane protein OmpA-like peptidoglycan-associated protein
MRTFTQKPKGPRRTAPAAAPKGAGWGPGATQTKLAINKPGDRYEQEADRLAERVMRTPESQPQGRQQRSLQASGASETGQIAAPPIVHEALRSPGQPLAAATRAFLEPRFGYDFSRVRVHADPVAEESARRVNARAYTVGHHMVFGPGRFTPDTNEGRRLIAHELAHVVQQSGVDRSRADRGVVQRQPYYEKSESEVVESVIAALQQPNNIAGVNVDPAFDILNKYPLPFQVRVLGELHDRGYFTGLLGYLAPGTKAGHELIVAIRFTECQRDPSLLVYEEVLEAEQFLKYYVTLPPELKPMADCLGRERLRLEREVDEARSRRAYQEAEERKAREREREQIREREHFSDVFERHSESCSLKKGVMQWYLYSPTFADDRGYKQAMQIKFTPYSRDKTVTFLQTKRELGDQPYPNVVDIGINVEAFRPFYGIDWDQPTKKWIPSNEGRDIGFRSEPSGTHDPAAYLFDEPYFFSPPHGRVFESVAVVPETGEVLGALTWGVGDVPAYAQKPICSDKPSSDFQATMETFYAPKNPAVGHGRENYDVILDGFAPNDAGLTADQKKQLDSIAAPLKEMIAQKQGGSAAMRGHLVVGGFGDSMDNDPMGASEKRAQAVAKYFTSNGVPSETIDLRTFGATWARYEVSTKSAHEGGNRRVQIRLFR